jgi:hypothetical protein
MALSPGDHLHLLAEARDRRALSRGVQGLSVRVARAINRRLRRRGKVFTDRYHARALKTPRAARWALRYVLLNVRKHEPRAVPFGFVDACSSAAWFGGFARPPELVFGARHCREQFRAQAVVPPKCGVRSPLDRPFFFVSAAAAQAAGFRPCLRCRPETAPEHGAWRGSSNTVARGLDSRPLPAHLAGGRWRGQRGGQSLARALELARERAHR